MDRRTRLGRTLGGEWRGLVLIALLLTGVEGGYAQPSPRVEIRVSADSVKVGERFQLTIVAEREASAEILFPEAEAHAAVFGDLTVLRRGRVQTERTAEGRRVDSVAYEVATFALDSARVPVLPIRVVTGGDTTITGSPPGAVSVISVVGSDAGGLRTPALLATFPRTAWRWGALALAVVALAVALVYVWWRRQGDESPSDAVEPAPQHPYDLAASRLQQLTRRNPNDRESCKAFYVELTDAMRRYLAERLGVRALERTTMELMAALRERPDVPDTAVPRVKAVLEQADLVKFADVRPDPEESQALLKKARGVLDAIEAAQRRGETSALEEGYKYESM